MAAGTSPGLLMALIRPIHADSLGKARYRLSEAVAHLDGRLAKVAGVLDDAEVNSTEIKEATTQLQAARAAIVPTGEQGAELYTTSWDLPRQSQ